MGSLPGAERRVPGTDLGQGETMTGADCRATQGGQIGWLPLAENGGGQVGYLCRTGGGDCSRLWSTGLWTRMWLWLVVYWVLVLLLPEQTVLSDRGQGAVILRP